MHKHSMELNICESILNINKKNYYHPYNCNRKCESFSDPSVQAESEGFPEEFAALLHGRGSWLSICRRNDSFLQRQLLAQPRRSVSQTSLQARAYPLLSSAAPRPKLLWKFAQAACLNCNQQMCLQCRDSARRRCCRLPRGIRSFVHDAAAFCRGRRPADCCNAVRHRTPRPDADSATALHFASQYCLRLPSPGIFVRDQYLQAVL